MFALLVVIFSTSVLILAKLYDKSPPPLFGVYRQKHGFYWLKVAFMYVLISIRKFANKLKKKDAYYYNELDSTHELSTHEKAIDAVYFNAANSSGDHLVVGTARRKNGLIDAFLHLKINSTNIGVLEAPKLPDSSIYQEEISDEWKAEGFEVKMLEFMKKWKVAYSGKLKAFNKETQEYVFYDVEIDGEFTSDLPIFNFDTDMDALSIAKYTAYESWSRDYFKNLEEIHQTHYEQFGKLNAVINIKDVGEFNIKLDAVRDHSFGKFRDWNHFHRYALHFGTVENGDHFCFDALCMPLSHSRLLIGYFYSAKDQKIYPLTDADFLMYQHGENGTQPKDFAFTFWAGGQVYTVQVDVTDQPYLYISKEWECKVVEGLCRFTVNGKKGWGAAEWAYRNPLGREVISAK